MTYSFADVALDTQTRRLLRDGQEVRVSPKAFQLLTLLIDNQQRAMSKAELHDELWPATFVQETNLAGLIAELRHALGDDAEHPRFIRTVHRFGYWFIGEARHSAAGRERAHQETRCWLIWETRQIALQEGDNLLGRAPDAEVWIEAPGVSRHHARIRLDGSRAVVEDLGSKNGTYVRGERITQAQALADGDQIRLASVVITFRIPPPVGSTDTVPV